MSRPIAVLRPEPGNAQTAAAVEAAGGRAIRLPLFEVRPLPWTVPALASHDAMILSSANAIRHAGPGLGALLTLPVLAVGEATAAAARDAGFRVIARGDGGIEALMAAAEAAGVRRALHLTGVDHRPGDPCVIARTICVYESVAVPMDGEAAARLSGSVALIHSVRAAQALGALTGVERMTTTIVAISLAAADAAGPGWQQVAVAPHPSDDALIALALRLAD